MRRMALVVVQQASSEIGRGSDILFRWMELRSEEVNVVHRIWLACQR